MKTKHFQTKVDISQCKDMWEYLKFHYSYSTMNSWNKLTSVANKVKVYDLPFKHNHWEVLDALENDSYTTINIMLADFAEEHPGYSLGFNGRSGGYLVVYNDSNNCNILPNFILDYDNYDEFKEYNKGDIYKCYKEELVFYTKLVRDFDKLCDKLIDVCDDLVDRYAEWNENNK